MNPIYSRRVRHLPSRKRSLQRGGTYSCPEREYKKEVPSWLRSSTVAQRRLATEDQADDDDDDDDDECLDGLAGLQGGDQSHVGSVHRFEHHERPLRPHQHLQDGHQPVEFQIDPQADFIDLSRSFFEVELTLKKTGETTWPTRIPSRWSTIWRIPSSNRSASVSTTP